MLKEIRPGIYRSMSHHKVKEFIDTVKAVAKNPKLIDPSQRLEICKDCEHYSKGRCKLCNCFMHIKARLAASKCRLNKWPSVG